MLQPGPKNLLTDVPGLRVGNARDDKLNSGVTVVTSDTPFTAAVDVRGGAPGTRETDLLAPDKIVQTVDALVLSGGSAFGLSAASGVADALRLAGRGFAVGAVNVPLVPAAIIFDLLNGGNKDWSANPYPALGAAALACASDNDFALGTDGAGTGATTINTKGGLGSASLLLNDGLVVAALAAVNPRGSVCHPQTGQFWAAPFELQSEFGGRGVCTLPAPLSIGSPDEEADTPKAHTTIAIVATNARLGVAQAQRVAVAAHDGIARAILPSHTPLDGDLVFAVATGEVPLAAPNRDLALLGHTAAVCLSRAIARGVFEARTNSLDLLPTWRALWG